MPNSADPLGLTDNFILQIQNLVDGHQASRNDVKKLDGQVYDIGFNLNITWHFHGEVTENSVAGGNGSSIHFGDNKHHFEAHTMELLHLAQSDPEQRSQFIEKLYGLQGQGLNLTESKQLVKQFPEFSCVKTCTSCSGYGEVSCNCGNGRETCISCGGSGRKPATRVEYAGNNQYRTVYYYTYCAGCGGSGTQTCSRCHGTGRIRCPSCSGHGYFTTFRQVGVYAAPSHTITIETPLYFDEISEFLKNLSRKWRFFTEKTSCTLLGHASPDSHTEEFSYRSESFLCALKYRVLDKQYFGLSISNPPLPFVKEPVFDDLFADEIAALKKIGQDGKITRQEAYGFFHKYLRQPALERSLREIAAKRSAKNEDFSNVVVNNCDGYITHSSASYLSKMMNDMLDKISPVYSPSVWWIGGGIFSVIMFFFAELTGEITLTSRSILNIIFTFLVSCAVSGAIFTLLSNLVVEIRSARIPKEYRQKMRNREAFFTMLKISSLLTILGISVASIVTSQFPQLRLSGYAEQILNHVICDDITFACGGETSNTEKSDSINVNLFGSSQSAPTLSQKEKVIFIQKELVRHGYNLQVNGEFGSATLLLSRKLLNKEVSGVDEIYNEFYQQANASNRSSKSYEKLFVEEWREENTANCDKALNNGWEGSVFACIVLFSGEINFPPAARVVKKYEEILAERGRALDKHRRIPEKLQNKQYQSIFDLSDMRRALEYAAITSFHDGKGGKEALALAAEKVKSRESMQKFLKTGFVYTMNLSGCRNRNPLYEEDVCKDFLSKEYSRAVAAGRKGSVFVHDIITGKINFPPLRDLHKEFKEIAAAQSEEDAKNRLSENVIRSSKNGERLFEKRIKNDQMRLEMERMIEHVADNGFKEGKSEQEILAIAAEKAKSLKAMKAYNREQTLKSASRHICEAMDYKHPKCNNLKHP